MSESESKSDLKIASRLSDVKEVNKWHSLQFPELSDLKPRVGHALISTELGKVLMIGGGNHEGALQEIYEINLEPELSDEDLEKRVKDHPGKAVFTAKYEFLCAKDKSSTVWMFGGANTETTSNQVDMLGKDALEKVNCLPSTASESDSNANKDSLEPCSRTQGSSSAIVECDGKEYLAVFSGGMKGEQPVTDRSLYLFDIVNQDWQTVKVKMEEKLIAQFPFSCQPPIVQGHVMTAIGSKVLVHGGINNVTLYDGYHWIDLEKKNEDASCSWIDCSISDDSEKPEGRAAHGIAKVSDVVKNSPIIYMFGGLGKNGALNDLWTFNFESMSWTRVLKKHGEEAYGYYPTPRLDFGMCSVGIRDKSTGKLSTFLLIHGGMNPHGELYNDAWVLKIN